jgi:hypothetical protein
VSIENSATFLKYEVTAVFTGSLKHVIQINNLGFKAISSGRLLVPLLKNETSRHLIIILNISSTQKHDFFVDDFGNFYAVWNNLRIDSGQSFIVEITYYVASFGVRYQINPKLVTDYNKSSSLYQIYTQPEELIESQSQDIILTAQNVVGESENLHERVLRIYNFVVKYLKYMAQEEEMGALWALRNGVGDCSEYSYLFVALCRAAGIPARVQAGFAFHYENSALEDGHMWAEYYLENYGWIPVDATWHLFDGLDYLHFSSLRSISMVIPYSNFYFNYTSGPKENFVTEEQMVSIKPMSKTAFGNVLLKDIVNSIAEIGKTKNVIFLGKAIGGTAIFQSEISEAEKSLFESMVLLQSAVEVLDKNQQISQLNAANALKSAGKALQIGWMVIIKMLTIFICVLTAMVVAAFVFLMKQYGVRWGSPIRSGA